MTATGAPYRVSSISSPFAARLRTAEKLLAACVALMRDTVPPYWISQDRCGRLVPASDLQASAGSSRNGLPLAASVRKWRSSSVRTS